MTDCIFCSTIGVYKILMSANNACQKLLVLGVDGMDPSLTRKFVIYKALQAQNRGRQ